MKTFELFVICARVVIALAMLPLPTDAGVVRSKVKVRRVPVARTVRVVRVQAVRAAAVCDCGPGCVCSPSGCQCGK